MEGWDLGNRLGVWSWKKHMGGLGLSALARTLACAGYWLGLSEQSSLDVKLDMHHRHRSLAIYPPIVHHLGSIVAL